MPHRVGVAEIETLFYQLGGQAAATGLMGDGVDHGIGWLPQTFAMPCRLNGCASVATIGRSRDRTLSIGAGLTGWTRHIITQWRAIRAATERQLLLMRALFDVTSGGVFWTVAFGPARSEMRILLAAGVSLALLDILGYSRASRNRGRSCSSVWPSWLPSIATSGTR